MQIIKKHFDTLHMHTRNHLEKLDAHVQKHAPKVHAQIKKAHAHLSKPAKHHHYWLALCGIILRSSIVTYTNSSFARQSLQDQFIRPTKSDLMILEPIDTINTLNPRNNLTGAYTGGDIIITALSFSHANLTPQNTIFANHSDNAVYVDITFKNNGTTPLYIPLINQPNNEWDYNIICYTNWWSGWYPARINKTLLQQWNYLLPGGTVPWKFKMNQNMFPSHAPNGHYLKCVAVSQAQQWWNPLNHNAYQTSLFEFNGQNNEFNINYTYNNPTNSAPVCSNQLVYAYTQTVNIWRGSNPSIRNWANSLPSCSCDINALDTASPHDCQFNGQRMNIQYPNITWPVNNAYWFTWSNVWPFCTDNHNAADGGVDVYLSILGTWNIPTCNQTGGNNTGINGFDLTITDITSTYNSNTNRLKYNFKLKNIWNWIYTPTINWNYVFDAERIKISKTSSSQVSIGLIGRSSCNYGTWLPCELENTTNYLWFYMPYSILPWWFRDFSFEITPSNVDWWNLLSGSYGICNTFKIGLHNLIDSNSSNILPNDINISNNSTEYCTTFIKSSWINPWNGWNNNWYGYGYWYGYTNWYGYGYGYGYRYAKWQYANSPIFYLTKPYIMISQSVWNQYKNINLLPTKMKKLAVGTIEKLFDGNALLRMASELQTSFDRTKQKIDTMKSSAKNKIVTDYQKARKLFEDGYTALFKKKGLWNKDAEQAIKRSNTKLAPIEVLTENIQTSTIKSDSKAQTINNTTSTEQKIQATNPANTKKDSILKRIKDKMRQLIKDKIKQVKSN